MKVQWGEVDGVPTLCVDAGQVPGPLHACLMFGTGRSDETLRASGINHIIEHLVLHSLGATPYSWNGEVNAVSTLFWAQGGRPQIVEFFELVVRGLNELPMERLAEELRVLEIESQRRGISQVGFDLTTRFGPKGAGLFGWLEQGLHCLDAETIVEWARTRFTTNNAVLWLSGPIPEQLQLRDLPMGESVERPQLPPPLVPERAYVAAETRAVSVSLISEMQWGILPIMEIARQRAHDRLRRDAISYGVEFNHVHVGGGGALEYLQADAAEGALEQVVEELVRVVDDLARSGPNADEVTMIREFQRQFRDHPQRIVSYLDSAARTRLRGGPVLPPDEIEAILDAQDPRSLQEDLGRVMPTILAIGPESAAEHLDDWTLRSEWSSARIAGATYQPITGRERGLLLVGADGVSWALDDERHRTVRWEDIEACFCFENGDRTIVSTTGSTIYVTPWNWQGGNALTQLIDDAVDPGRIVQFAREPSRYRNRADDEPPPDVRWLGSIVGALDGREGADVVIDADGVFVLYGVHAAADMSRILRELRTADRRTLLAIDRRNRWIPEHEIEVIKLRRRIMGRVSDFKAALTIRTVTGHKFGFLLKRDDQIQTARDQFPRLLGSRFVE